MRADADRHGPGPADAKPDARVQAVGELVAAVEEAAEDLAAVRAAEPDGEPRTTVHRAHLGGRNLHGLRCGPAPDVGDRARLRDDPGRVRGRSRLDARGGRTARAERDER